MEIPRTVRLLNWAFYGSEIYKTIDNPVLIGVK